MAISQTVAKIWRCLDCQNSSHLSWILKKLEYLMADRLQRLTVHVVIFEMLSKLVLGLGWVGMQNLAYPIDFMIDF